MDDYRERLMEEYTQLAEKFVKLGSTIDQALEGTLPYKLHCPLEIMMTQYFAMQTYLSVLDMRIKIEGSAAASEPEKEEAAE